MNETVEKERGAGVLCHISSLPNKYGVGSLGKEAYEFCDLLAKSKVKYWQILPLVHTGYGDSPYQSVCCNSGNPYFIDLEALREEDLLDDEELKSAEMPEGEVDFATLFEKRFTLLRLAYARFNIKSPDFSQFVNEGEYEDYALFMSLKARYGGTFDTFPESYKYREPLALTEFRRSTYKSDFCFWLFLQFTFLKQWKKLKEYCNKKGVKLIGDLPLYVAYDSADVWGRPELFQLDDELKPTSVAGVPPDYFSKTGQLWGNPLYNWDMMQADGYDWWIKRIKKACELYDVIRIDHFRGLDRYYSIPAANETAEGGEWQRGPGMRLFGAIKRNLGEVDIIAEDLGILDFGVLRLRGATGYPGMKVLQFAFDGKDNNAYLPKNIEENSVVYTGTHDNNTTLGFLNEMTDEEFKKFKKRLRSALESEGVVYPLYSRKDAALAMNVCALASNSYLAVLPVQDVLLLDGNFRMNVPSTAQGNWKFRLSEMPDRKSMAILKNIIKEYNRQ